MNLLFELSGENQRIAAAEISCAANVYRTENGAALAVSDDPQKAKRLAQTHTVSKLLGECGGTKDELIQLLDELNITASGTYCCRAKKIYPASVDASQLDLEKMMGQKISGKVSLKCPDTEYRAVFTGGRCFLCEKLFEIDRGSYAYRNPQRREFFHPGVMMPLMARTIVNLTHVESGELLLDPFCGTGGMLLECRMLGVRSVGSDYDPEMLEGCRKNLKDVFCIRADAENMPYSDETFDAIATDLPYGQSTKISADSLESLYTGSLKEMHRVLKSGKRAVIVTHKDIRSLVNGFKIEDYFEQRVHKSLTRRILVLSK